MNSAYSILPVAAMLLMTMAAHSLPPGFKQKDLISGLDAVSAAVLPDGRVLAIEKFGKIHLIKNGERMTTPFFNWEENTMSRYEKGMMCVLADPDFAKNGYIYIQYCNKRVGANGQDQVSRFTVKGDVVDGATEKLIISLGDAGPNYHHGSGLVIGGDGKLYIGSGNRGAVGDGAPGPGNSADRNKVQGKVLRVNIPEGDIPADNPFYGQNTGDGRAVYAWGLRNPFTMSYNPKNKAFWFSHVMSNAGDDQVTELVAGADYGFLNRGGKAPLFTASSSSTFGRAMIGSLWYTGRNFPAEWQDMYYFGGINVQNLRAVKLDRSGGFKNFSGFNCPIDVKEDPAGAIYVTTRCQTEDYRYTTGKVTKVWYGDNEPTSLLTPEQMSSDAAARRMDWNVLPGGRVQVKPEQEGAQVVELRSLDGRRLAASALDGKGSTVLSVPGAHGTHLLIWSNGVTRAVTKVVL